MAKKQFILEDWLKDKSQKVVTRCGFPVRIVCTDVKRKDYPILALVERDDQEEYQSFTKDGRFSLYNPLHDNFDLFIETADEVSEDEKVREELIKHLKEGAEGYEPAGGSSDYQRWLAWLEKQGDQKASYTSIVKTGDGGINALVTRELLTDDCEDMKKTADKVEPKFHEGEWITNGDYTWIIVGVKPLDYVIQSKDGNIVDDTISHIDEQFHSFTIADAKNGDVLYINNTVSESIMIYKSFNNGLIKKYASYNKFGFEGEHYLTLNDGYITPATKEQHDTLMKAMVDAGYTFDFENKKLKKIEPKPEENKGNVGGISANWSELDAEVLDALIRRLEGEDIYVSPHLAVKCLKSLKDRVQPKQEWNEEDEACVILLDSICESSEAEYYDHPDSIIRKEIANARNWLKSLRPQSRWKPSSEQIGLLQAIINEPKNAASESCQIVLREVLEQLKKLKEE